MLVEVASWHWIFLVNIPFGLLGIVLALRWWPETWDLTAARKVDLPGMALLGGAIFCLTFGARRSQPWGWQRGALPDAAAGGGPAWRGLRLVGTPRPGADDHARARQQQAVPQREPWDVFFGAGALGTLLLLSLVFVNLWGYTQLEAALALTPVPLCGLIVWPLVGKVADTKPPARSPGRR